MVFVYVLLYIYYRIYNNMLNLVNGRNIIIIYYLLNCNLIETILTYSKINHLTH